MKTLIVDYGMSNLGSIRRSLEECGADAFVSEDPRDIKTASRIVLPGVGSFVDGMAHLVDGGWTEPLREAVKEDGLPLLGICLGMQLLAGKGLEGRETAGLGLIPGEVIRLSPVSLECRVPHVGWNEVHHSCGHPLFTGIPTTTDFYFVHSYHFVPDNAEDILASTPYCGSFVSAIARNNVCGTQFHPEKSSRAGFQLLRNFLAL
jgi:glutamine amidotransferase